MPRRKTPTVRQDTSAAPAAATKAATINDIARLSGVSKKTVSRIINHKDENISQETRERVLRVIEENDYVPYAKIRERIFAQTRSLGLVIPTFHMMKLPVLVIYLAAGIIVGTFGSNIAIRNYLKV